MRIFPSLSGKTKVLVPALLVIIFAISLSFYLIYSPLSSKASPTSATWTTKGDFENNVVTTGAPTTRTNIKVTGTDPADDADVALEDPSPHVVTTIYQTKAVGVAVNSTTNKIYVSNQGSGNNYVSVIDGDTNRQIVPIYVGSYPVYLAVNEQTNEVYVPNQGDNTVSVIRGATNEVTHTISVGDAPFAVAVNEALNKIYVTNGTGNSVSVIDGDTKTVIGTITVGVSPQMIAAYANKVYVVNSNDDTVSIIDSATDIVIKTVLVGDVPYDVAANSATGKIYVSNLTGQTVSVIDGQLDVVVDTINGTYYPKSIATNPVTNRIYVSDLYAGDAYTAALDGDDHSLLTLLDLNAKDLAVNTSTGRLYGSVTQGVAVAYVAYPQLGTISGLKIDAGEKVSWKTISWNATILVDTQVSFRFRGAETEESLTSASWSYSVFDSGIDLGKIVPVSTWLEVEARLASPDGLDTPTLHNFTVNYEPITLVSRDCSTCHTQYPQDNFENYLEENNVLLNSCSCHQGVQGHNEANYSPYGDLWFKSESSLATDTPTLHSLHLNDIVDPSVSCSQCHRTADCGTCHQADVPHGTHGNAPPQNLIVCDGSKHGGNAYTYSKDFTCLNSQCHNVTFDTPEKYGSLELAPSCETCHPGVDKDGRGPGHSPHGSYSALTNLCKTCHKVHEAKGKKIAKKFPEVEICYVCHDGSGSTSGIRPNYEGVAAHDIYLTEANFPTGVNINCMNCHHPHGATEWPGGGTRMTKASEENLCYQCHNDPSNSENNINIEERFTASSDTFFHHDVTDADQTSSGGKVECVNCHNTHMDNRDNKVIDPDDRYTSHTATRYNPITYSGIVVRNIPAVQDSEVRSGSPNTPQEGNQELSLGYSTDATLLKQRALIKFDLSSIPANATIVGAYLFTSNHNHASAAMTVNVYRLAQDWNPDQVTWNSRNGINPWGSPGGSHDLIPSASKNLPDDSWTKHFFDLTDLVSQWYNGVYSNYGVILIAPNIETKATDAVRYISATEFSDALFGPPALVVEYYVPKPTSVQDSVSFCLKCHDGDSPSGVTVPAGLRNIALTYLDSENGDVHGGRPGEGSQFGYELVPPYHFGMAPLSCGDCHDPHGSSNIYHLREEVNGKTGISLTDALGVGAMDFCTACHVSPHPPEAGGYDPGWACFELCHYHGAKGRDDKPDF